MDELKEIEERYERRKQAAVSESSTFVKFVVAERNAKYQSIVRGIGRPLEEVKLLEIGAGSGGNLHYFKELGLLPKNIYANELLDDRVEALRQNHPDINVLAGDASQLDMKGEFDIIFQSTVLTSVLDDALKAAIAKTVWELLKPGGIVLWYDFQYDNPRNPDVKGIKKGEIRKLFLEASIEFQKVTLAPPIGRRIGKLYKLVNSCFPFLRTHLIATIRKAPN